MHILVVKMTAIMGTTSEKILLPINPTILIEMLLYNEIEWCLKLPQFTAFITLRHSTIQIYWNFFLSIFLSHIFHSVFFNSFSTHFSLTLYGLFFQYALNFVMYNFVPLSSTSIDQLAMNQQIYETLTFVILASKTHRKCLICTTPTHTRF